MHACNLTVYTVPTRPIASANFLSADLGVGQMGQRRRSVERFAVLRFCKFQPNAIGRAGRCTMSVPLDCKRALGGVPALLHMRPAYTTYSTACIWA